MNRIAVGVIGAAAWVAPSLVCTGAAAAGPLNKGWVAGDANWVVHVDLEAGLDSTLGRFVREHEEDFAEGLEAIRGELGLDPFTDFKSMTVYGVSGGEGAGEDAVAVIAMSAAVDRLVEMLPQAPEVEYQKLSTDTGHTLHSWTDKGKRQYGHVRPGAGPDERIVLISPDVGRLVRGIDALEGKGGRTLRQADLPGSSPLATSPKAGSIVFIAANDIVKTFKDDDTSALMQKAEGITLDLGEAGEEMYADMVLVTTSNEDASNVSQMLQGLVAMGRLFAQGDPELAEFAKLTNAVSFASEGRRITASVRYGTEGLVAALKELDEKDDEDDDDDDDDDDDE